VSVDGPPLQDRYSDVSSPFQVGPQPAQFRYNRRRSGKTAWLPEGLDPFTRAGWRPMLVMSGAKKRSGLGPPTAELAGGGRKKREGRNECHIWLGRRGSR